MAEIRNFTMNFGSDVTSAVPTSVFTEIPGTSRHAAAKLAMLGVRHG